MRGRFSKIVEDGRSQLPDRVITKNGDTEGMFLVQHPTGRKFKVLVGNGMGWDHVSVSCPSRKLPNWDEMCWIKRLFFEDHECVVQYHPPTTSYVNHGPVLHLWRPQDVEIPMPPIECV